MIIEMKRLSHYIAIIILTLLVFGCTKEYEGAFQDSADERVKRELEAFKTQLLTAENGWKGYIYTGTGHGFLFFMEFRADFAIRKFFTLCRGGLNQDHWNAVLDSHQP